MRTLVMQGADGRDVVVRPPYCAPVFAIQAGWVDAFLENHRGYSNASELADYRGGSFAVFVRYREFERGGVAWATFIHPGEWAIEVEVGGPSRAVIALHPWEAWALARERDQSSTPPTPLMSREKAFLFEQDGTRHSFPDPRLPDSEQQRSLPPPSFAVPPRSLTWYRTHAGHGTRGLLRDTIHGPLSSLHEYCRLERDGTSWLIAMHMNLWVLAIELTQGDEPAEIHAVPPELARRILLDPEFGPELMQTYPGPRQPRP